MAANTSRFYYLPSDVRVFDVHVETILVTGGFMTSQLSRLPPAMCVCMCLCVCVSRTGVTAPEVCQG